MIIDKYMVKSAVIIKYMLNGVYWKI